MAFRHPLVVLPTYNEAENLRPLAEEVLALEPGFRLLIVDDASPDGTGAIAEALAAAHPGRVEVLHRPKKEGLGRAYLAAFARALRGPADAILQMDADFSHPPALLPELLRGLEGFDVALGSRYVPRGGIRAWGRFRRTLSRGANAYARRVLALPVRDLTSGLKAWRREVVEFLVAAPIDSLGYCFQIECTARALAAGFSWTEIPFVFSERRQGTSKMSGKLIWEAFWKTWRLGRTLRQGEGTEALRDCGRLPATAKNNR